MRKVNKFLSLTLVFIFLFGAGASANSYNVKEKDTLWDISEKYMKDMEDILWANPLIDDPDLIYPGEVISIPEHNTGDLANNIAGSLLNGNKNDLYSVTFAVLQALRPESNRSNYEQEIIRVINKERTREGRVPLTVAGDISGLSINNNDNLGTPFTALKDNGILYLNIATVGGAKNKSAKEIANTWLKSDAYRIKILSVDYHSIAVGYVPMEILTAIRQNINLDAPKSKSSPAHDSKTRGHNPSLR